MGGDGLVLGALVNLGVEAGGDHVVQLGGLILDLDVVELGARDDLDDGQGARVIVADHGDGDLGALDALLDQHTVALGSGLDHSAGQHVSRGHAGHTVARAVGRGLHKDGQAQVVHDLLHVVLGELGVAGDVVAAWGRDVGPAVHRLGDLLLGAGRRGEHAGEGVGHVQDLEQALDAAVLAVVAVHRDVGDVVAARGEALHKVDVGHVHQVYLGKPCLEQRLLAGAARLHRDVALVRPAAGQHDYLACKYVFLCHEKPFSCTRVRLYQRFGNVR